MKTNNIFEGDSYHALFAQVIYKWFICCKWVAYADIKADHLGLKSAKDLSCNVSNCDNCRELKKAFRDIGNTIIIKVGNGCFKVENNNLSSRFNQKK